MLIPEGSKFSEWKYVEVANYVPSLKAVIRFKRRIKGTDEKESIFMEYGGRELDRFCKKHNNVGIYTSVYRFADKSIDGKQIAPLYFDLDAEEDPNESLKDVRKLFTYLTQYVAEEAISIYYTGSKGFHLEVEPLALGISPDYDLSKVYKFIAESLTDGLGLTTVDGVYDRRRMWRLPDTIHQSTGRYKALLPHEAVMKSSLTRIIKFAELTPDVRNSKFNYEPSIEFSIRANQWFREWCNRHLEHEERLVEEREQNRLALFQKYGTTLLNGPGQSLLEKLFRNAHKDLAETKTRNITLNKHAFILYSAHLKSGFDITEVTSRLEEVGKEIGLEQREITATLKSAENAARRKLKETNYA